MTMFYPKVTWPTVKLQDVWPGDILDSGKRFWLVTRAEHYNGWSTIVVSDGRETRTVSGLPHDLIRKRETWPDESEAGRIASVLLSGGRHESA